MDQRQHQRGSWTWAGELPHGSCSEGPVCAVLTVSGSSEPDQLRLAGLLCVLPTAKSFTLGPISESAFLVKADFKDSLLDTLKGVLDGHTQKFALLVTSESLVLQKLIPALGLGVPVGKVTLITTASMTSAAGSSDTADTFKQLVASLVQKDNTIVQMEGEIERLNVQVKQLEKLVEDSVCGRDDIEARMLAKFMFVMEGRDSATYRSSTPPKSSKRDLEDIAIVSRDRDDSSHSSDTVSPAREDTCA